MLLENLQVARPESSWNQQSPPPPLLIRSSLSKQAQQFLSSVATHPPAATNKLISKFVASSPKSIALNALSHILSPTTTHPHLSSFVLLLYSRITEESWFSWNVKLIADVIALLYKQGQVKEAESLVSEILIKLERRELDLVSFYCNLIDSHSKHDLNQGVSDVLPRLHRITSESPSIYVKERAYESMISSLYAVGRPLEAENLIEEMKVKGLKPSVFEFRPKSGDISGLRFSKSIVFMVGFDPLRDKQKRYCEGMERNGKEVKADRFSEKHHVFFFFFWIVSLMAEKKKKKKK